ncbi:HNH endonuclease [Mycolicibacterium lacusdiani]|uniref:HNH endonuclease n=1 Tax=Mycolicibacterium lacusdiani TaxID=2895283 RepID=UPI001F201FE8|nr:HNH endonuclease [Mycolicibacterium lacusdiani]
MSDVLQRLQARTTVDPATGCWTWTGGTDRSGYGRLSIGGKMRATHRLAYAILGREDLDDALVLHHDCRNRRCWNPHHLEQVTSAQNTRLGDGPTARHARATHCPQRHPYTAENTRMARGRRHCRTCHRDRLRRNRARVSSCRTANARQ